MMTKILIYICLTIAFISCSQTIEQNKKLKPGTIKITWTDNLQGDFSFKENWDYPESVYKNDFGQLDCDGICPSEIDRMKDENGKIFTDSLKAFYNLVDTTHQYHSIQSEAQCYEWAGTDFITVQKINNDTIICFTHNNAATHSSLKLIIAKEKCVPTIELNSIIGQDIVYTCKSGKIEIDKTSWGKKILKTTFDFTFDDKENPNKSMYWKGKIYAKIETQ